MNAITNGEVNKALIALVPGIVALVVAHFGFQFSVATEGAIVLLVTSLVVYLVPNTPSK